MKKTANMTILEIILLIAVSFLSGFLAGFLSDLLRGKNKVSYIKTRDQKKAEEFHDDLAMEMGELR